MIVLDVFDPGAVPAGSVARVSKRVAAGAGGDVAYPVVVVAGAHPGPTAAFVAGIHGDEFEGPRALWELARRLDPATLRGRVVMVLVAHVAAFAAGSRASPVDGVNLARVFPGDAGGTVTHRLAHDLFGMLRGADFLVDLHSGGVRYAFLNVAGWYGGPPGSLALARDMALPLLWRLPDRAGVLSYEACRAGIAACGTETGGRGGCLDQDVAACRDGLLRVLTRRGMIDDPGLPDGPAHATTLEGDWMLAPCGGSLEPVARMGARVAAGEVLARILGLDGEVRAELAAAEAGLVMGERHLRSIEPGEWATCALPERAI